MYIYIDESHKRESVDARTSTFEVYSVKLETFNVVFQFFLGVDVIRRSNVAILASIPREGQTVALFHQNFRFNAISNRKARNRIKILIFI